MKKTFLSLVIGILILLSFPYAAYCSPWRGCEGDSCRIYLHSNKDTPIDSFFPKKEGKLVIKSSEKWEKFIKNYNYTVIDDTRNITRNSEIDFDKYTLVAYWTGIKHDDNYSVSLEWVQYEKKYVKGNWVKTGNITIWLSDHIRKGNIHSDSPIHYPYIIALIPKVEGRVRFKTAKYISTYKYRTEYFDVENSDSGIFDKEYPDCIKGVLMCTESEKVGQLAKSKAAKIFDYNGVYAPNAEIDPQKYLAVTISMGLRPTGGYSVDVERIFYRDGFTEIIVKEYYPGKGMMVTEAFTCPGRTILIPNLSKKIKIVTETGTTDVEYCSE